LLLATDILGRCFRIETWLPLQLSLSAFETAQIQGFWSQSLGQAWFPPTQGRLLHDVIGQKTLDLGRIGVRNSPDPGFFGQKLGRAWFSFQKGLLLHDDWPKKP
jgi:hypothetical protein